MQLAVPILYNEQHQNVFAMSAGGHEVLSLSPTINRRPNTKWNLAPILFTMGIPHATARCEDIAGEAAPVRLATIKVLFVAANSMKGCGRQVAEEATFASTGRLASMERPIKSAVVYLLACRSLTDSPIDVDKSLRSLASASDMSSMETLVTAHAEQIVEGICAVRTIHVCYRNIRGFHWKYES